MAPPRAGRFVLADLAALDDEALREFLAPGDDGVSPGVLGVASQGADPVMVTRFVAAIPATAVAEFDRARTRPAARGEVDAARSEVIERLFWPLLYWHEPAAYEELVAGERIHPDILAAVRVDGRVVCDVGAGTGRFTMFAAASAARVIAVDGIPPALERLRDRVLAAGIDNVELRRGSFTNLPVADRSVDIAVSCSAVTSRRPFGGEGALAEMERITRPGGRLAVIWPDRPEWFVERGFTRVVADGNEAMQFADAASAERLCRDFYSGAAATWAATNHAAAVPYAVLGVRPPNDMCVRDLPA